MHTLPVDAEAEAGIVQDAQTLEAEDQDEVGVGSELGSDEPVGAGLLA